MGVEPNSRFIGALIGRDPKSLFFSLSVGKSRFFLHISSSGPTTISFEKSKPGRVSLRLAKSNGIRDRGWLFSIKVVGN